jgi:hypothetical protein
MANQKITQLSVISCVCKSNDIVAIVDMSCPPTTKKVTVSNLLTCIVNSDLSATAGISASKLEAGTKGDILISNGSNFTKVGVGINGKVLTACSSDAEGVVWACAGTSSPLTTKGDVYAYSCTNARLAVGTNGQYLKSCSGETTGLIWSCVAAGGGATATHAFTNQSSTSYTGTGSAGTGIDVGVAIATEASGVGEREIYIRKIDSNNEGVFTVIHKNGTTVEVQIA